MAANSSTSNFKGLLRLIVPVVLVFGLIIGVSPRYREAAGKNQVNAFTAQRFADFYALEPQILDMVFVGSSHAYCTFDPELFDKPLGIDSFQLGTPLQHPDTTYFLLQEVFRTQTPLVVVMELYWDVLDGDFEPKQAEAFFEVLENPALETEYRQQVFPLGEKVKYHIAPIRYQKEYLAYRSKELEEALAKEGLQKNTAPSQSGTEYYRSKGYVYCDIVMPKEEYDATNQFRELDGAKWSISEKQKAYLEKIAALCREQGSQLIFVTAPIANVSMEHIQNYDAIHEVMAGLAKEQGVPYLDYNIINQETGLLSNKNFRDDAHLNDSGVQIVDAHFLRWLQEN